VSGRGRTLAVLVAALVLVDGACDSAHPPPCPGERVGTFHFESVGVAGGDLPICPGAEKVSFTATLTFDADSKAYLCLDRLEAQPLQGTRQGDNITLVQRPAAASVTGCACDLTVEESLDLGPPSDGDAASFEGELRDVVKPAGDSAASCEPEAGAGGGACGVPCEMVWQVRASPT